MHCKIWGKTFSDLRIAKIVVSCT